MTLTNESDTSEVIAALRRDVEYQRTTHSQTYEEMKKMRTDLEIIAEALLREAKDRDWCTEYNYFVDNLNNELKTVSLKRLDKGYTTKITLLVRYECADGMQDEVAEGIAVALHDRGDNLGDYVYEITDQDYSNPELA